ncbi:hypothetical protein [Staphylococcus pettenkoferi]|uniref:hypothetical protein n=1 Tax=Staphylococcus pettenkoferi TaxID=170573 RepID=UPI0011A76062|nr:hypothetical protein [Staphylococcus pettenkoferi]
METKEEKNLSVPKDVIFDKRLNGEEVRLYMLLTQFSFKNVCINMNYKKAELYLGFEKEQFYKAIFNLEKVGYIYTEHVDYGEAILDWYHISTVNVHDPIDKDYYVANNLSIK